ncbi:hypothetical protein Poli38472_010473 [Pythium oligandrum]|uniref:Proteasome assembly chaperone 4 n=1 Tax=Pythium oligandrum TaxID=41045 RepID=A0A8K1FAZ7_PYTOL|nr:hypothetical protein Poli38472_010473 [Pythium oligandrum]|eukprot:TMW55591.1 hypothetical protein Poli38472_010473 [Pythium oligandrum]
MAESTAIAADANVAASLEKLQLENVQGGMKILNVSGNLLDQPYLAQIWVMEGALFVWIGSGAQKPVMGSMSTAVMTRYSPMPLITSVVGAPEMEEQQIAQRLARRTGKQCFVSCQLPDHLPELFTYVERQILARLTEEGLIEKK